MFLPINDAIVTDGFCWGLYEATVDAGPRIRLPRAIIRILKQRKVEQLWLYPDPTGPRLIICPGQSRPAYMEAAQENLPKSLEPGEAYRKFICAGECIAFRDHGRVSITAQFNREFKAEAGEQVVIVGVGLWYELWRQDDWLGSSSGDTRG